MNELTFTRRKTLIGLTSLLGAAVLQTRSHASPQNNAIDQLIERLPNKKSCIEIGALYFNTHHVKINFFNEYNTINKHLNGSYHHITSQYRKMVKEDFKQRNIVNINGLILSKHEATLYVFTYLKRKE